MIKLAVTTGDSDGIGFEVTAKALAKLGPQPGYQFYVFRSNRVQKKYLSLLDKKWTRHSFSSLSEALKNFRQKNSSDLVEIVSKDPAPFWVVDSAKACMAGVLDGICTAPLSKTLIRSSGLKDQGHTEIFKRLSHTKTVNMGFVGRHFSVVLITDHVPYKKVPSLLSKNLIIQSLQNALYLKKSLPRAIQKKPLALLGLNPHAGEDGIIGRDEVFFKKSLSAFLKKNNVEGPLTPDTAFLKKNWSRYSLFVATYHDQGLIPFKIIHGQDSGVHISLGLPFVRTSVDHGTAKDIYGLDMANPQSMIEAIQWCQRLSKTQKKGF